MDGLLSRILATKLHRGLKHLKKDTRKKNCPAKRKKIASGGNFGGHSLLLLLFPTRQISTWKTATRLVNFTLYLKSWEEELALLMAYLHSYENSRALLGQIFWESVLLVFVRTQELGQRKDWQALYNAVEFVWLVGCLFTVLYASSLRIDLREKSP